MTPTCANLEAVLRGGDNEATEAFARHVEGCAACRDELALSREISYAAPSLRKSWESPDLEGRIRAGLLAEARARRRVAPPPPPKLSPSSVIFGQRCKHLSCIYIDAGLNTRACAVADR